MFRLVIDHCQHYALAPAQTLERTNAPKVATTGAADGARVRLPPRAPQKASDRRPHAKMFRQMGTYFSPPCFFAAAGLALECCDMEVELKNRSGRAGRVTASLVASATLAAFILALAGAWSYSSERLSTGPASSIGKSGEMKSPGGQTSDAGLYGRR